jgi:hypothetical protein
MTSQYSEIVENSFDCLDCYGINPLHLEAKRPRSIAATAMTETALTTSVDDVDWTDAAGVGSRDCLLLKNISPNLSYSITS